MNHFSVTKIIKCFCRRSAIFLQPCIQSPHPPSCLSGCSAVGAGASAGDGQDRGAKSHGPCQRSQRYDGGVLSYFCITLVISKPHIKNNYISWYTCRLVWKCHWVHTQILLYQVDLKSGRSHPKYDSLFTCKVFLFLKVWILVRRCLQVSVCCRPRNRECHLLQEKIIER